MQDLTKATKKSDIQYSQKSVLIIEDFHEFARSLHDMVSTIGYKKVDLVYNGEDAIKACKEKRYDIILSDYNLGDSKDGQQVLEELHHYKLLKPSAVFIMITAENTTAMVMGAMEFQPDSYLAKPFNGGLLRSRMDRAIVKNDLLSPIASFMHQKKWQEACEKCDEIFHKNPKYKMACLRLKVSCHKHLKQYSQALAITSSIVEERPIPWAMLSVGEIYYAKNLLDKATEIFSDMIEKFPMALEGYDWLAKILYEQKKSKEAQTVLEKAIEKSPKALHRQKLLGEIAESNNDLETMTKAYRKAIKVGKNSTFSKPDEFIKLTKSLEQQLEGAPVAKRKRILLEADTTFSSLNKRFKSDPVAQFRSSIAQADFCSANNDEANKNKHLSRASRTYERIDENITPEVTLETSKSLKKLGQEELAEALLEKAIEQNFDNPEFVQEVSQLTNNKSLIDSFKKVSQLNHQAITSFKANNFESAIEYFSKAAETAPNNININLNHAQALLKHYQANRDKEVLKKAEKILHNINRLDKKDKRYPRYSELNRLTQLMLKNN